MDFLLANPLIWLLPVGAIMIASLEAMRASGVGEFIIDTVISMLRNAWDNFRHLSQYNKSIIAVCLSIAVMAICFMQIKSEIRTSVHWQYVLQILTGNWSSQQPQQEPAQPDRQKEPYISDTEYVAGVIGALVINLGPYLLIFGAIWSLIQNGTKEKRMLLKEAIDAFEIAARAELIKRFMDDAMGPSLAAEKIEKGLAEGRKAAVPIIRAVFGPEDAKAWENAQNQEITLK